MNGRIAYIDDNRMNLECIQAVFEDDFAMDLFQDGEAFLQSFGSSPYAAILSDVHMPVLDGFALYEKIISHSAYNGCPILFISSDDSDTARIRSLTLGAVDFLCRMISADEMIARVRSKILFFQKHRNVVEFDRLKVNLTHIKTSLDGKEVPLTFIELKVLLLVLRSFPDPVTRDAVIDNVWGSALVQDATIHTHIFNLNSKLQKWDYEIQTSKGKGVQLVKREAKS